MNKLIMIMIMQIRGAAGIGGANISINIAKTVMFMCSYLIHMVNNRFLWERGHARGTHCIDRGKIGKMSWGQDGAEG
jgi:hypothetical protein